MTHWATLRIWGESGASGHLTYIENPRLAQTTCNFVSKKEGWSWELADKHLLCFASQGTKSSSQNPCDRLNGHSALAFPVLERRGQEELELTGQAVWTLW